jgi:hypothetical protein
MEVMPHDDIASFCLAAPVALPVEGRISVSSLGTVETTTCAVFLDLG